MQNTGNKAFRIHRICQNRLKESESGRSNMLRMPADSASDPQMEIGHVLAMDVVGYSKLLINEQSEMLQRLNEIVRGTNQFRAADAQGKLIRLPTGDGIVLVFFNDPQAPIECATEISAALKKYPDIPLRMGIHSGPISRVLDVNERANVAGAGIDLAQRVMDCGDAGHILLSKRVADDLTAYSRWNAHLRELGECEVKHGRKISLVNFFNGEIGNPETPTKVKVGIDTKTSPRRLTKALVAAAVLLVLLALGLVLFRVAGTDLRAARAKSSAKDEHHVRRVHSGKIHRRFTVRKFKRRQSERLFHRWRAG